MKAEEKRAPARRKRKPKPPQREEIEALWAEVMRDGTAGVRDRMHAAELCARAIEAREEQAREEERRQQQNGCTENAAVGRLDEVLHALWGCKAGEWDG